MVQLDKLRLATRHAELEVLEVSLLFSITWISFVSKNNRSLLTQAGGGRDPDIIVKNASESKGGVIEKFIKVSFHLPFLSVHIREIFK